MSTIFEKNIAALRDRHTEIKDALLEMESGQRPRGEVHAEVCDAGGRKVLLACRPDGTLYQLGSMYSDEILLDIWQEQTDLKKIGYMAKFIFFGIGNGCIARKVLSVKDDSLCVIIYEPSLSLFYDILCLCDVSDVLSDERLILSVEGIPYNQREYLYKCIDFRDLKRLVYRPYPNYKMLFRSGQKEFLDIAQVMYNAVTATQDVMARYGKAYYDNALHNIRYFLHARSLVDLYVNMPKDLPCILVASGPSLDKNISCLKGLKGRAFMIAADSAVRVLLRHGIVPDMFVSADAKKNQKHFEEPGIDRIPMLTEISCNYRTLDKIKAPMFFCNDLNAHVNYFLKARGILLPYFATGGSVAHDGYALASSMDFQTIILVGQDLAYTDNKTHSQESVRGEWHINTDELDGYMTEGYYGGKVKTSYEFQLYREWFEVQIADYPNVHTINATEGGALIKGAENMPLAEAIERCCTKEYDVEGIISGCREMFDAQTKRDLLAYMLSLPDELKEIANRVRGAVRDYDRILELAYAYKFGGGEMKRLLRKTGEVSELVEKAPVMCYIQDRMQETTQKFLEQVYDAKDDVRSEIIDTAKLGKENLQVILATIQECMPELEAWKAEMQGMSLDS